MRSDLPFLVHILGNYAFNLSAIFIRLLRMKGVCLQKYVKSCFLDFFAENRKRAAKFEAWFWPRNNFHLPTFQLWITFWSCADLCHMKSKTIYLRNDIAKLTSFYCKNAESIQKYTGQLSVSDICLGGTTMLIHENASWTRRDLSLVLHNLVLLLLLLLLLMLAWSCVIFWASVKIILVRRILRYNSGFNKVISGNSDDPSTCI